MKLVTTVISIVLIPALAPAYRGQSFQADTQAGDFFFRMPAGWTQTQQGGVTKLVGPSTTAGTSTSILLTSFAMDADLRTSFNKMWAALLMKYQAQQIGEVVSKRLPGGNDAFAVSGTAMDGGKKWAAMFLLAQNGNRGEMLLFITDDLGRESYAASQQALQLLLASVRFQSADSVGGGGTTGYSNPPVSLTQLPMASVPANPARLPAIYRAAVRSGDDPTRPLDMFDPARKTPDYSFLIFFPDGHVKRGLITQGLDGYVDDSFFRHDIAGGGATAAQWGIFQVQGGSGRIVFANPALRGYQLSSGLRGEVWDFTLAPDGLEIRGEKYYQLNGGAGLRLEGIYKPFGDTSQPGIKFTSDGQFVDEGILDSKTAMGVAMMGGGVGMAYGFNSPHAGRGTYHIVNYGLQLSYANGQIPAALFFLEPGRGDTVLYINNVKYQKVQ